MQDVSPDYEYSDDDINKILTNRVECLLRENNKNELFKTLNALDTYIDNLFTANETISKVFPDEMVDNLNDTSKSVLLHQWQKHSQILTYNNQVKAMISNMSKNEKGEEVLDESEKESLEAHFKIRYGQ